jgi:hypothetical protein
MRYWKPEDVFEAACPHCGGTVEFWKDDPCRVCRRCGERVENPRFDTGCAAWCAHAKECKQMAGAVQGDALPIRERLIAEMKRVFGTDERRIRHALAVLEGAEELLRTEAGDPLVVRAAAILHDIGILEAERKHGSAAGRFQEMEGPPIARHILADLGLGVGVIDHVCRIVGNHHSARDIDTPEFRILWDADWLVNLPGEFPSLDPAALKAVIDRTFKTPAGRSRACRQFVDVAKS